MGSNELTEIDEGFEPETSPEQNSINPEPENLGTAPAGTEPPAPETTELPQDTAPADEGTESQQVPAQPQDVDEEPMTTAQMREHMKKLESQVNSLHRRLAKGPKPPVRVPEPVDDSTAPKIEDFDTIEAYEKAHTEWDIDRRIAAGVRQALQPDPELEAKQDRGEAAKEFAERAATKYPDYYKLVHETETTPLTITMFDAAREIEHDKVKPEDVLYYLGKNPTETAAISRMSPYQTTRAIDKIVTKLADTMGKAPPAKTVKTVSDAAPPIKPTDSTVIIHKDPEKMTQAEYEQWRMGQSGG